MKLGIGFALLFCVWLILRLTNILQFYSVPSSSNAPTIKKGSHIWASRFKTLQRGNFIAFRQYDSLVGGIAIWTKRCVGMQGDTVEMKNGLLFVNGKNADVNYTLDNEFAIFTISPRKFIYALHLNEKDDYNYQNTENYLQTILSNEEYKEAQSLLIAGQDSIKQYMYPNETSYQPTFFAELGKSIWTVDNFGPLRVPINHYFVLGDNRHSSLDSRYIGFIKKENYVGAVLGK